jgi:hypothetical protein
LFFGLEISILPSQAGKLSSQILGTFRQLTLIAAYWPWPFSLAEWAKGKIVIVTLEPILES